jgi:peptidoglycan hydrolase CwlO-like protein
LQLSKLTNKNMYIASLQRDVSSLNLDLSSVRGELDSMCACVGKRNSEIDRLTDEVTKLSKQLETATLAKVDAVQKYEDVASKEIELSYR